MQNPYASPELSPEPARPPLRASFTVGAAELHAVAIYMALGGEEVYVVDGAVVFTLHKHPRRQPRRFIVGTAQRHEVEVRFVPSPLRIRLWHVHDVHANVYVDGQLVAGDLFPERRKQFGLIVVFLVIVFIVLSAISVFLPWAK